jgi:manganese-dependent inorganic pyrophosphatase
MVKELVFGHANPDTDAVASAIGAAYLMEKISSGEIQTEAVVLGEPNDETKFALDKFGVAVPRIIQRADTDQVILVDHNETQQSVSNISEVKVTHVFDHHKINFQTDDPIFYHAEPAGSTSSILAELAEMQKIDLPKEIAGLMMSAVISDTLMLKSPTTTPFDQPIIERLAKIAGIEDYQDYGMEMLKAGTDLSGKSEQELIDGDAKTFEMNGKQVRIGQVNTVDINSVLDRKDRIEKQIQEQMQANKYDDFLFVITDILNSNSKVIFVGSDQAAAERAFNVKIDDDVLDLPGVVSRKKQIVPPLTEAF